MIDVADISVVCAISVVERPKSRVLILAGAGAMIVDVVNENVVDVIVVCAISVVERPKSYVLIVAGAGAMIMVVDVGVAGVIVAITEIGSSPPERLAHYGQQGRPNWWARNQERLDKVYNKYIEDAEKEARKKEEEEKEKVRREDEAKQLRWKHEREQLEAEMGARLEKRIDALGAKLTGKEACSGCNDKVGDELAKLRSENEELKRRLGKLNNPGADDKIMYLQREIMDLRKQVAEKHSDEDAILALQGEIGELTQSAYLKTNFETEIAGLRKEIGVLREQNERITAESNLWKEEAARPGNKRGSVVVGTPDGVNHGSPKPRWTGSVRGGESVDRWKAEYRNLRSLHRLANIEVEALKEKRGEAERKRIDVEKQVKALEEQMSKLCGRGQCERRWRY
ncbi:hypothetical protein CBR_g54765 [Chara braunii]|uniref:Uncharacterized protein n=1 Tax=Chara braunii TaxID=69332 RepID=A0A388MCM0_CHABU|nr:hypothetical protein CBR_g54765 [Chara braunii]|eukprot:GBG92222.1 hypothetical protein CBR_g54765 [Chara braunii]